MTAKQISPKKRRRRERMLGRKENKKRTAQITLTKFLGNPVVLKQHDSIFLFFLDRKP